MAQFAMKETRERRGSCGNVEELMKRKREESELGKGEEEVLRDRKKSGIGKDAELRQVEGEGELLYMRKNWKAEMGEIMSDMARELKGWWREEMKNMKEEVKEGIRERVSEEMDKVRKELRESEKRWVEEREEFNRRIKGLEEKMERLGDTGRREGNKMVNGGGSEAMGNRLNEMENRMERREREERRRNVLIKGVEVKEGRRRGAVEELFDSIGIKAEIEEVRKIGGSVEEGREMMVVRLKNEDQKREIWNKKKLLKGRKERILEDWTWKERRMRWSLERIAKEEEKKGRKVWIGYGKIRIDEKWWRWDEEEEVLKDGNGNLKKGEGVGGREKDGV
ncbi:hypothetical protein ACFW04_013367 [Cataglyphis niger]